MALKAVQESPLQLLPQHGDIKSPAELPANSIKNRSPTTSARRTFGRASPGFNTGLQTWIFILAFLALYLALSGFLSGTFSTPPTYRFGDDARLNVRRLHGL